MIWKPPEPQIGYADMAQEELNGESLRLRGLVLFLLGMNWIIAAIAGFTFLSVRSGFPSWFAPVFILAVVSLLAVISFYLWQVFRGKEPPKQVGSPPIRSLWLLLVLSVVCTSALHKFFPLRPDTITRWPDIRASSPILQYNFVLTACSLLAILALGLVYSLDHKRPALIGLLVVAAVMLIPNDDCGNDFNRPWLQWIGASPLMFMPNSVVVLIGYCGLHGIRPRVGVLLMAGINAGVLLLGLGHLTRVVW